jgi:RIO-like serine/threonine protein kinase
MPKKNKKTMSLEDAQMYLLLKCIMDDVKAFQQYAAIRHLEIKLTKSMNIFMSDNHTITLHDFTRWMMKKEPKALKLLDEAVEKVYKK